MFKLKRRGIIGLGAAALAVGVGGTAFAATSANPAATVTAVTHIQNDPDSGSGGNTWAIDQIDRTVTLTPTIPNTAPASFIAYTATVSDTGSFEAIAGQLTPNQVIAGQKLSHSVHGTLTGTASYTITAPAADALAASNVEANLNDGGNAPASTSPQSLSEWPVQAFGNAGGVTVTLKHFSYTYVSAAGESWTDADTNSYGLGVSDGNITGLLAPPPVVIRLSHGHGTATAPTRETVSFQQSGGPSWDEFQIVGPGAINGHKGWVPASVGTNFGYYEGLLAHHGYTAYYVPVEGRGSSVQIPGSHGGYVYFVS